MAPRSGDPVYIDGPWTHRSLSANGTRFHVAERGDGPLVLLLHGFPEFWWAWRHQLTSLSEAGFRAVAVDLRGYGGSDKPPRGYDLITAAADAAGLVRSLGEANAIIVGHDWGGLIGWTTAAYFPKVVRRLAVISVPHPLRVRGAVLADPRGQGRRSGYALGFQLPVLPERQLTSSNAGLVGRRGRAPLPRGDVHALGGPLRAGVPPLVRAVPVPAGRAAVRAAHAVPDPGAHAAPAWRAGQLRPAGHGPGLGPVRGRPVPVAAAGRDRALPARGTAGTVRLRTALLAGRPGTGAITVSG